MSKRFENQWRNISIICLNGTNYVILQVINKLFHTRPNLLLEMRAMHDNIERRLKIECHRELELILEMEESFVYADNPLYKDTLKRTQKVHKSDTSMTTTTHQVARLPITSTSTSAITSGPLKRSNGALSEDNDDDLAEEFSPRVKISRPSPSFTTTRFPSCKYSFEFHLLRCLSIYYL